MTKLPRIAGGERAPDAPEPLAPIRHRNMTDEVYTTLRDAILSQRMAPGQRIHVDELRQQLGVSRTPLKDALNRLALQGLVRVAPRYGTFVSELRASDMAEIGEVRLMLELHAVERGVPRATRELLRRMHKYAEMMRDTVTPEDNVSNHLGFVAADHGFHQLLIEAAGNRWLVDMYDTLNVHIQMARVYYMSTEKRAHQVCDDHDAILAAFAARDVEGAQAAVRRHLETSRAAVIQRLS